MLYFEHHYKFRTILYSLEPQKYTKLWVHGNWGRTETGDTTVLVEIDNVSLYSTVIEILFSTWCKYSLHFKYREVGLDLTCTICFWNYTKTYTYDIFVFQLFTRDPTKHDSSPAKDQRDSLLKEIYKKD